MSNVDRLSERTSYYERAMRLRRVAGARAVIPVRVAGGYTALLEMNPVPGDDFYPVDGHLNRLNNRGRFGDY